MLDLRTINIVTGLMGLLMAAVLLGMRHYYPGRVRGALLWGLSPIVGAGSALAYSLDSVLPPVLVVVLGNGLAFGSAALNLFGSAAFHGHVLNGRRWLVFTATVMALLFCFIAVWPDYRVRVVVAALAMTVFAGVHAWLHWCSVRSFAVRFLVLVLVIRCVILLVRVVSAPFTETAGATIFHASAIQALHLGSYSVGGMLTCLGLVLLASERVRAEFERLANTDLLTGAASRRAIMQSLEVELERWRRTGRVFSVLLLDIDHFKRINDSFGHATGDLVLAHFSASIKPTLRAIDTLGRWGGEEFLVLLPESDVNDAALVAERVREVVQGCAARAGLPACTTSIGCASIATSGPTLVGLLAQADAALYRAKHDGRNCVRVA